MCSQKWQETLRRDFQHKLLFFHKKIPAYSSPHHGSRKKIFWDQILEPNRRWTISFFFFSRIITELFFSGILLDSWHEMFFSWKLIDSWPELFICRKLIDNWPEVFFSGILIDNWPEGFFSGILFDNWPEVFFSWILLIIELKCFSLESYW